MILIGVFSSLITLGFSIFFFDPYLAKLNYSIWHTRATLLFLPQPVIRRVPGVMALLSSASIRRINIDGDDPTTGRKQRPKKQLEINPVTPSSPMSQHVALPSPTQVPEHSAV